jgi:hypothetical protein
MDIIGLAPECLLAAARRASAYRQQPRIQPPIISTQSAMMTNGNSQAKSMRHLHV